MEIRPIYPCGFVVTPKLKSGTAQIKDIDMKKVRELAQLNSPILLRGFQRIGDLDLFQTAATRMGCIMPWKFGNVLIVKDAGAESGGLNNVLSSEPMPMHFDGLFKTEEVVGDDGSKKLVPRPPR